MSSELETTPGASDGSQGQVADSNANQEPIDFSKTPQGRAFMSSVQSTAERQANEERQARIAAQRQLEDLKRQNELMMTQFEAVMGTVQHSDPKAYDELVEVAKISDRKVELKQAKEELEEIKRRQEEALSEQRAYQEAFAYWNNIAGNLGLNPSDPEYQAAVQQTLATGNTTFAHQSLIRLSARKNVPETAEPDFVMPSGGSARPQSSQNEDAKQRTLQAYRQEISEAISTHDESRKGQIRMKYRKIFREKFNLPDIPA